MVINLVIIYINRGGNDMTREDFTIRQLDDGNFVVLAAGIYQNIDFINGGFITTDKRATEILDLLLDQSNTPVIPEPTDAEKIAALELQNEQYTIDLSSTNQMMSDMLEMIMPLL